MVARVPRGLALITGASSGIGRALAHVFAAHGHDLVLTARREAALSALAGELAGRRGIAAHVVPADLADPAAPQALFAATEERGLAVDVLVNNAGYGMYGRFADLPLEAQLEMTQVNVRALTALTYLYLDPMRRRGRGRVLNVASTGAFQPGPLLAVYFAGKSYVLMFSEALASELAGSGVTVTCFCPGPTRSEFQARAGMQDSRAYRLRVASSDSAAQAAYRACMAGRAVAVHGLLNKLMIQCSRAAPRALVRRAARLALER
jgi:short-subunit dehydrogenase